jgi:hypothetical protein
VHRDASRSRRSDRPSGRLVLVRFDAGLHDAASAAQPPLRLLRVAEVVGRTTLAILAGAVCLLMFLGVLINLFGTTP